ncbi:hypothetical protein LTR66_016257, partial [Elasticomyces elasticus]
MSRSTSVASSKRSEPSKVHDSRAAAWPGRSHVSAFVHNLHLLQLDQLHDWPAITLQSYGSKSTLQHRLRATEWVLYRLFEIHDARLTRDKLRPFFPSTTPLGSKNLRAALYRQLGELKKNGILGPNIQLRQTMLDECKGERFEEVLAAFSMIVLRKIHPQAVKAVTEVKVSNLLPLILAQRKALQSGLEERERLVRRAATERTQIAEEIKQLKTDRARLEQTEPVETPVNADRINRLVRENWMGDGLWADVLIHSDGITSSHYVPSSELSSRRSAHQDLQHRIDAHKARLTKWQNYLSDVKRTSEIVDSS